MLSEDSGLKEKLLEKILELFSELPDKEDEKSPALEEVKEGEGLHGLGTEEEKLKGLC
jgi:hypothetical protein